MAVCGKVPYAYNIDDMPRMIDNASSGNTTRTRNALTRDDLVHDSKLN